MVVLGRRQRLVVDRVEHLDDVAVDVERVRNPHLAVEQVADRLRDDRLAVAGRPVDEERVPGVHGRTELIEHPLAQDEVRKRFPDLGAGDQPGIGRLERHHVAAVLRHRHRRDAGVHAVSRNMCARSRPSWLMR